jgi:signal transduction histidine kinase
VDSDQTPARTPRAQTPDLASSEGAAAALVAAGRFFAARQVYGLAWIDADLIVRARFGDKADFIAVGKPVSDSVIAYIGSEDFIASFQHDPTKSLELPGIVIVNGEPTPPRYNLSLFWSAAERHYLLLIARAALDATLEVELLRHVRARLMAEAETSRKSRELARANRDLEDFAAIISHDLKSPMRALTYMTDDVATALGDGDAVVVAERLASMRTQTRRLSSMLSGLLEYSSIGRKCEAVERVDTRALVDEIVASIPRPAGFTVTMSGVWPAIETLKAPLDLVIRNLLDNAVKHHDQPSGTIELACTETVDALNIAIMDDGPGITAAHREAIFLPFRTLSPPSGERAGVGLGLALVARTVEQVGATLTLREPLHGTRGATFDLAWPRHLSQ